MKTKLNIPTTIKVGFQNRQGTYTGKLAYIIYYDNNTNKLRKEYSWEQWRSKDIEPVEYPNEPLSGFVLNKEAGGGYSSRSWDKRNTYIRIYDPRGFEFEITVDNLLFILQETNSIKGKALEGEFIYSWAGKDLVLLPTNCTEYKESVVFTDTQTKKISRKDIVKGYTYLDKNMEKLVYIGRYSYTDYSWDYNSYHWYNLPVASLRHIFYNLNTNKFVALKGFTKLAELVSDEVHTNYADYYQEYVTSPYNYKLLEIRFVEVDKEDVPACKFIHVKDKADDWYYVRHFSQPIVRGQDGSLLSPLTYNCIPIKAPSNLILSPTEFTEWSTAYIIKGYNYYCLTDVRADLINIVYGISYRIDSNGTIKDV